jgi:tetratricopeptide (TPR) repeat protein
MLALALPVVVVITVAWWLAAPHRAPEAVAPGPAVSALPVIPEEREAFAGYAGSVSCRNCHEEAFALWEASNHGRAERKPEPALDGPAFAPTRTFRHGSQETTVGSTNGEFRVTTIGLSKKPEEFTVQRVIGHDPLRQFLVAFPGGRYQTLEASYDPRSNDWFNVYGIEDRQPGEWGHWTGRGMNWNDMCAGCHNTRVRKNYDAATDSYHTSMAEKTVGCESCHGPLKAHQEWQEQFGKSAGQDPTLTRLTRDRTVQNCGFCHARRGDLTGDFKPGDDFDDHMRLSIVDGTDTYYPDGQVREENYEYTAFLGSRMHLRGVACMDCHNPHSAKTLLPGNWLCLRCHDGSMTNAPVIEPVSHSRHTVFGYDTNGIALSVDLMGYKSSEVKESGGECVNCHMPQTSYMQRHWRHDHGFTIPDPLLTQQLGVPNACNRCHKDKDAAWAQGWVEKWYGPKMDRPSRRRTQVIAAGRQGEAAARDPLVKLLATEEIPYWRAVAAGLLGEWSHEPAVGAALLERLTDTNALVRAESVRSLEPPLAGGVPGVATAIRRRLEDPARNVRIAAAWALRSSLDPSSKAGAELLHFMAIHADQPVGQMQLGAYASARNDPQTALAHYRKAVAWDPNSAIIHHDLAVALSLLDRSTEAAAELETATRLAPDNAEFFYKLGLARNECGDPARTVAALETAVRLDPRHARAWYNLGLALNSTDRPEDALAALTRAETASPADPRSPYARATILARLGRRAEAIQAARRALEIRPDFAPARGLLDSLP